MYFIKLALPEYKQYKAAVKFPHHFPLFVPFTYYYIFPYILFPFIKVEKLLRAVADGDLEMVSFVY